MPTPTLKKDYPEKVSFKSFAEAFAFAHYLKEFGFTLASNVSFEHRREENKPYRMAFTKNMVVESYSRTTEDDTLHDFVSARKLFFEVPIKVGKYTADIQFDGVNVGCTFVPWEVIEDILSRRPDKREEQKFELYAKEKGGSRLYGLNNIKDKVSYLLVDYTTLINSDGNPCQEVTTRGGFTTEGYTITKKDPRLFPNT